MRALAVYCDIEINAGGVDSRALTVHSDVAIDQNPLGSRAFAAYSEVQPNPSLSARALAVYNAVSLLVAEDTPLEIHLLDASSWSAERILPV